MQHVGGREPNAHRNKDFYMKHVLMCSILVITLGGCAIVPAGYGDQRNGYYPERSYNRDGYHGDRHYNQNDRHYRDYGYRSRQGTQGDVYQDHGG
jgi:hypothetical protein